MRFRVTSLGKCGVSCYVSLSEEQLGNRPPSRGKEELEEEKDTEEKPPLEAHAPDASLLPEQPAASASISACQPLQDLDELLSLGRISQTNVAKLKNIYRLLQDTLKSTQDSEIQLSGKAKSFHTELERLQTEVESDRQSPSEKPEDEVNALREQLLQAYEEVKAAEDRESKMQHNLKCLLEEKHVLEKEEIRLKSAIHTFLNAVPQQIPSDEQESRTKPLQDKREDPTRRAAQRQQEVGSPMKDVQTQEKEIVKGCKGLKDKNIIEVIEAEEAQLISIPDQILKEIEKKRSKRDAAKREVEVLSVELSDMDGQVKEVEQRNYTLRLKRKELSEKLEGVQAELETSRSKGRELRKEREVKRAEEVELTGDRGIMEMKLQSITCDKKHLCASQSLRLREKNRQRQALQRMEQSLTIATEQLQHTQSICRELQAQLDAVPSSKASIRQRTELQREVDTLKVSLEKQLLAAMEENQRKQQNGTIQGLLKESNSSREELHNLRCLTKIKAEERGQKHRERLRAEQLNQHIEQELLEKDLTVMEHKKLNTMLQCRLSQYCKLCRMMTEEKNKYIKLKQIASQTITELTEQVKVQENEAEIQRTIVINKDRSLTEARMKIYQSTKVRDKLRNDITKVAWKHNRIREEFDDNQAELMKLTQMIKLQDEAVLEINKNHEAATQRRNFLGIQLLEREELLATYNQQVDINDAAITEGQIALEKLEKEMRGIKLELSEEKRQLELKRKEVLLKQRLEEEITELQAELLEARGETLEALNRTANYKELKGKDPSSAELVKKIQQLEVNLAARERQVLEKELLMDQLTRLSKPLSEQAESCKRDSLSLAKKLNEVRSHIIDSNQSLMAVSAQLSMKQATALSLQQELKEREHQMDRCQRQLERGLPPCPEMEEEWRRMLRDEKRRQRDKEERERLAEENEWNQLPNGEYTTAEPRPTAYIPQTDPLPVPKPYGAQAPFKPSQPGANMRHIRKPALKPSET